MVGGVKLRLQNKAKHSEDVRLPTYVTYHLLVLCKLVVVLSKYFLELRLPLCNFDHFLLNCVEV